MRERKRERLIHVHTHTHTCPERIVRMQECHKRYILTFRQGH